MTQDELDNGIGNLVRRYSDNEKAIAVLKSRIRGIDNQLNDLRAQLETPERMKLPVEMDIEQLNSLLTDFQQAMDEKEKLESCLKQAGLENLIQ